MQDKRSFGRYIAEKRKEANLTQEELANKLYVIPTTISKCLFNFINISYLIGIITCFICNLVIDHKLSWFLIVLLGIMISFTITSLPLYLKRNKYRWFKVAFVFTILVYLLLFIINYVNNGDWLFNSFEIATFVFTLLWIDVLICTFTNIDKSYKISIILISLAVLTAFTSPLCEKILNISSKNDNFYNIITSVIMVITAFCISLKKLIKEK